MEEESRTKKAQTSRSEAAGAETYEKELVEKARHPFCAEGPFQGVGPKAADRPGEIGRQEQGLE